MIREARENAVKAGVADKVKFLQQDLFETDIREATVVTLYLWPEINLRLRPKLLSDLKPGTRVVSHNHDMGDWKPLKTVRVRVPHEYVISKTLNTSLSQVSTIHGENRARVRITETVSSGWRSWRRHVSVVATAVAEITSPYGGVCRGACVKRPEKSTGAWHKRLYKRKRPLLSGSGGLRVKNFG